MRLTRTRKAVAFLLLFAMFLAVVPPPAFAADTDSAEQATGESAADRTTIKAQNVEPETAVPTEAPEDSPAPYPAATEPVGNEAETAAEEATAPALETTEDPNLAWNTQPGDGVQAVDDQGRLIRSSGIGGHGSLGWVLYPKQGAYAYTHSWIYANGNSATTTFGENGHFLLLNYLTPNGTPPNTVLDYENNPVVYCIQPEKATVTGRAYWSEALTDVLSSEQIEAIKILCAYGWPWGYTDQPNGKMNTDDETAFQYQAATQILIWEVVMGIRSATPTYYVTDSRLYEVYNGTPTYTTYGDNSAFIAAYQEIAARLRRHNTIPSFANASASNAATYAMSYNGSNYTLTLTDNNGVLDLDYSNFSAPDGISVSKSGNSLTITATPAALENGEQTITMTGKKLRAGFQNIWVNGQGDQYLTSLDSVSKIPAYFKLRADTKTISLKKTSSASASVMACIQGNPRYTLRGAVYEIHQGSATGPVVETLTTDANGNATGTVKYAVNTVLYAVEKTAPAGYKLNSTPVLLTVSADSSQNVFNVSDEPVFDPARLVIMKTGVESERIPNTIFKADFYASTWMDSNYLQRTWYLKSDSAGIVQFDDAHLLSSYGGNSSDELFKPNGQNNRPSFPLGCVYVQEIQAADGYITPVGNDAGVLIFINQPTSGGAAEAYWGDAAGQPITTQNPRGIYKMENDSDGTVITAENQEKGTATMKKTLPANTPGGVEGYYFNLFRAESSTVWYGRTDANGNIYKTNASHAAVAEGSRVYQFEGLEDGTYSLRELLSQRDFKNTKTQKIRITTSGGTTASVDLTYQGNALNWDTNGDCYISGVPITGLNGGGTLSIEITNAPIYGGPPTLVKKDASTDLPLEGAIFQVDYYSSEAPTATTFERRWFLRSDDDGCVTLDAAHLVNTSEYQSDELYETGKLPIGCIRVEEVEAPEGFRKSDSIGYWYMKLTNPQTFAVSNYWGDADGEPTDDYGEDAYVIDNELYVENTPSNTLTIRKTSSNGRIKGITFEVRQYVTGHGWLPLGDGTYVTGDGGKIEIPDLPAGTRVQIKEIVQEGSICLSQNPQEITLQIGDNPVNFENVDISLKIKKECSDGKIDGITFKVEKKVNGSWTLIGSYVTGTDGIISIATEHLAIGAEFRITETAPQNYICVNTPDGVQTVTLHEGENVVTFVNKPVVNLKVIKQSDDGNVAEIEFKLYRRNKSGIFEYVETYVTDTDGFIVDEEVLEAGKTYKLVETVPENYVADEREKIFVARLGQNTVTFINHPVVTLKIVKHNTDPDGPVDGFKFKVERKMTGSTSGSVSMKERWASLGTYITANGGIVLIDEQGLLHEGDVLRITEIELGDYVCLSENPQTVTLALGENVVEFTNKLGIELEIIKESDDGKVSGITFTVERKKSDEDYSFEGSYTTGQNGTIHLEDLELGVTYRVTETLPYGYTNDHISQEITVQAGTNTLTFVNHLIPCSIKIVKVDQGTRTPLEGAGFYLFNERGEKLAEGYTDSHGQLKFEDLRVGSYSIQEFQAPPGFELDDTVISVELTPDVPDIKIERENEIIPGLIRVHKENDKGQPMAGVTYLLEYSLDDTNTWLPIQSRDADSPVQCGYSTSANIVNGCITTGADGIAEFAGLAINNQLHTIKYRLTEVGTQDGYDLLAEPVFEGYLTEEQVELEYKVVNHRVFEMPMTGENGFTLAAIGSALAVLLAVIILLRLPKKKEDETL